VPGAELIILPGSKHVRCDLNWLRSNGWEQGINRHLRYGGRVIGICGAFQMLGSKISDPDGVEDAPGESSGLNLLAFSTRLTPEKRLRRLTGKLSCLASAPGIVGYEIHCGESEGPALLNPAVTFGGAAEGAMSDDGQIIGTYVHGLFDEPLALRAVLEWAGLDAPAIIDPRARCESDLDRIADDMEACLDLAPVFPAKIFGPVRHADSVT